MAGGICVCALQLPSSFNPLASPRQILSLVGIGLYRDGEGFGGLALRWQLECQLGGTLVRYLQRHQQFFSSVDVNRNVGGIGIVLVEVLMQLPHRR